MLGIFSINVSLFRVPFILSGILKVSSSVWENCLSVTLRGLGIPGTQEVLQVQTFPDSLRVGHPNGEANMGVGGRVEAPALRPRSRRDYNTQNMNGGLQSDAPASLSQGVTGDMRCHLRPYLGTLFDQWLVSS